MLLYDKVFFFSDQLHFNKLFSEIKDGGNLCPFLFMWIISLYFSKIYIHNDMDIEGDVEKGGWMPLSP